MWKLLFYNFRSFILASKMDQRIMFFQSRFVDLLFLICFRLFFKMVDFETPFKIQWDRRWQPKSTKWRHNAWNSKCWYAHNAVFFQTLFSRNHTNPCAVGTSWLFKGHFFYVDWLMFCFRCFLLCFVLNSIFDIFSKNIGKRPAVELSVFWGNRRT